MASQLMCIAAWNHRNTRPEYDVAMMTQFQQRLGDHRSLEWSYTLAITTQPHTQHSDNFMQQLLMLEEERIRRLEAAKQHKSPGSHIDAVSQKTTYRT